MTIGDLIQIANDEGRDPNKMELVIAIGGMYFDVDTSDNQDPFNPDYVCMTVGVRNQVVR